MNLNDLKNAIEKYYPNANNGICFGSNVDFMLLHSSAVWKLRKSTLTLFCRKFREINCFTKQVSVTQCGKVQ